MADRAQVTSVDAIEMFRSNLIIYLSKAKPTLEEVSAEVMRMRQWLQSDHRRLWEQQLRERKKKLERAQNELFSATLSKLQEASAAQYLAVRRAQESVREAEEKLSLLKRWDRELEHRSEPLLKQVEQFHHFLSSDMPKAIAYLSEVVKTLEAYAGVVRPGTVTTPAETSQRPGETPGDGGEGSTPPGASQS